MPPFVIPLFISHEGCPHRCIFCDQHRIAGRNGDAPLTVAEAAQTVAEHLARPRRRPQAPVEVAFYGGSFSCLPRGRQQELLGAVRPFLKSGAVRSIRISTRPDCIDAETVRFLADRGVATVELGVQAMDDAVLVASRRGHTVADAERAWAILRRAGMRVGGQLMVGLPAETAAGRRRGAERLVRLRPDFVRLYPTLVVAGSGLAARYARGEYRPLTLPEAVAATARLKAMFDAAAIPVVRMGLQPTAALERTVIAGPYHPAFGELVQGRLYFRKLRATLAALPVGAVAAVAVAPADQSILRGPGNVSLKRLATLDLLGRDQVVVDPGQPRHAFTVRLRGGGSIAVPLSAPPPIRS